MLRHYALGLACLISIVGSAVAADATVERGGYLLGIGCHMSGFWTSPICPSASLALMLLHF